MSANNTLYIPDNQTDNMSNESNTAPEATSSADPMDTIPYAQREAMIRATAMLQNYSRLVEYSLAHEVVSLQP